MASNKSVSVVGVNPPEFKNSKRIKRVIFGDSTLKFSGKVSSCWIDQCNSITDIKKISPNCRHTVRSASVII